MQSLFVTSDKYSMSSDLNKQVSDLSAQYASRSFLSPISPAGCTYGSSIGCPRSDITLDLNTSSVDSPCKLIVNCKNKNIFTAFTKITKAFYDVINQDELHILQKMMQKYPNYIDEDEITPLKIAICLKKIDAVKTVISTKDCIIDDDVLPTALKYGNVEIANEVLKCNVDINAVDDDGNAPLILAAVNYSTNSDLINSLLTHNAIDVNCVSNKGDSPLYLFAQKGCYDTCIKLLNNPSIKLDIKNHQNKSFIDLLYTCNNKNLLCKIIDNITENKPSVDSKTVNKLFAEKFKSLVAPDGVDFVQKFLPVIDINYQDIYGNTHLINSLKKSVSLMTIWLENNTDITLCNKLKMNFLMIAIKDHLEHHTEYILNYLRHLIEVDTDTAKETVRTVLNQMDTDGESVLFYAIKQNNIALIEQLCSFDLVDVNIRNIKGETPLIHSIVSHRQRYFDILITRPDIDINLADYDGLTPLMHVIVNSNGVLDTNSYYIHQILNHPNLDINKQNNYGETALIISILKLYGGYPITNGTSMSDSSLLEHAVYFNSASVDFNKPVILQQDSVFTVQNKNKYATIQLLLSCENININLNDNKGKTPFIYAVEKRDKELFNILINNDKVDINSQNKNAHTCLFYIINSLINNSKNEYSGKYKSSPRIPSMPLPISSDSNGLLNNELSPWLSGTKSQKTVDLRDIGESNDVSYSVEYAPYSVPFASEPVITEKYSSPDDSTLIYFLQRLLTAPKLDVNIQDFYGNTILTHFIMHIDPSQNHTYIAKMLLDHKNIKINQANYNGTTPLMYAVDKQMWNYVNLLLKYGANPDLSYKDNTGNTVKMLADQHESLSVLTNIVEKYKTTKGWFF